MKTFIVKCPACAAVVINGHASNEIGCEYSKNHHWGPDPENSKYLIPIHDIECNLEDDCFCEIESP